MSRARKIWKWAAALTGAVLVLLAIAIGGLRLWLNNSPTLAPEIVARVEQVTGLRFAFASIDARLGLRGPELVFRSAHITMPGQHDELVSARAGRVGFDVWDSLRAGRVAAARVVLEGAQLQVYLTADGIELRGQGNLGEEGAHLRLDELPVGRVRIEDSTVTVKDQRSDAPAWRVDRVNLELERDPHALDLSGDVRLPDALGAELTVAAHFKGDLEQLPAIEWQADIALKHAALGGWTQLMPQWRWLPTAGRGDLSIHAAGRGVEVSHASGEFALQNLVMTGAPGVAAPKLAALEGTLDVTHDAGRWRASGRNLVIDPGHDAWRGGEFALELDTDAGDVRRLRLASPALRLDALGTLVALLPEGEVREAGAQLAPRGALTRVDVTATRGTRPTEWRIDGGLNFAAVSFGAWRSLPGLRNVDGEIHGTGASGRVRVHSKGFALALPKFVRSELGADEVSATLDWWWQPDGWHFGVDDARTRSADGRGGGKARLWLPADGDSPRLVLDLKLYDIDARAASKYLPGRVIPAHAMAWLDRAFLDGKVNNVTLEFAGPTRDFPFKYGGGLFRIRAPFSGVRVHYLDGYADVEGATGVAEFRNQGFTASAGHARVGELEVTNALAAIADFGDAELTATAHAKGDLHDGLRYLQSAPIGAKLGSYFLKIGGSGPIAADVVLDFPFTHMGDRHIEVRGSIDHGTAQLPGIAEDVRAVTGSFRLRDLLLEVPDASASVFGGTVHLKAHSVAGPSGLAGDRLLLIDAQGRSAGDRLQAAIGITEGHRLDGTFDWRAQVRVPHYEWQPPPDPLPADAPPTALPSPHETLVRWLPLTARVDTTLTGLAMTFPAPVAKAADEARATRLDLAIDPGLAEGAPPLPASFKRRDQPHEAALNARVQLGRDAGVFDVHLGDNWSLHRGTLRFGGGAPALRDGSGVWVEGHLAEFDLSAWFNVRLSSTPGKPLGELLRGATVIIDDLSVFGFHFAQQAVTLSAGPAEWRALLDGPSANGTVVVPWDLKGAAPLSLDLNRLVLGEHRDAAAGGKPTDVRELPAVSADVRNLEFQKRHFGALAAHLARVDGGLKLDHATLKGASYQSTATGHWLTGAGGEGCSLKFDFDSTDLLDTLTAWGFAPAISAKSAHANGELHWSGGIDEDVPGRVGGAVKITVGSGQLLSVAPGAGRVLGLLSLGALPRRLTLDFSDLTDKGFAFDQIHGDFDFRDGNAYTTNLVLKGPAAEIGIVGRTGIKARDYDQTAKVTGNVGGSVATAVGFLGGPAVGAAVLLFSTVFKEPLSGLARGYYRITGSWEQPKVERIGAAAAREAESASAIPNLPPNPTAVPVPAVIAPPTSTPDPGPPQ